MGKDLWLTRQTETHVLDRNYELHTPFQNTSRTPLTPYSFPPYILRLAYTSCCRTGLSVQRRCRLLAQRLESSTISNRE